MPISTDFILVFVLFEILELFEYLVAKYSIFEVELFLLESETLILRIPNLQKLQFWLVTIGQNGNFGFIRVELWEFWNCKIYQNVLRPQILPKWKFEFYKGFFRFWALYVNNQVNCGVEKRILASHFNRRRTVSPKFGPNRSACSPSP